jgi:hypothetical protein
MVQSRGTMGPDRIGRKLASPPISREEIDEISTSMAAQSFGIGERSVCGNAVEMCDICGRRLQEYICSECGRVFESRGMHNDRDWNTWDGLTGYWTAMRNGIVSMWDDEGGEDK